MTFASARSSVVASTAALVLALGVGACGAARSSSSTAPSEPSSTAPAASAVGFEGVPIERGSSLASPSTTGTAPVHGISCGATEQLAYHIHVHLVVYVDGQPRSLPGGIGIPGSVVKQTTEGPVAVGGRCLYWLHTHAPDGIIHVESPIRRLYNLGQFFDLWRKPLSAEQVAGARGTVSAVFNGRGWTRDVRAIPLAPHAVIQLSVGEPSVPFQPMSWAGLQL